MATVIPEIISAEFASRIADLFPRDWGSDDAKQSGNVFAVFLAAGEQMHSVLGEIQYAALAQRILTETSPELDLASVDFLGDTLPRPPGMDDANFAQLIIDSLFQPAATRSALQNAVARLTGVVPRMLEPWNIFDTGVWRRAYWNVDTPATPARWGNGSVRYQGFIETIPQAIPAIGVNNPIYCWGSGPLGPYWNVPGYFFAIISANSGTTIYDLLNRIRAYGTIVWVKLLSTPPAGTAVIPSPATLLTSVTGGTSSVNLTWSAPATGTAPFTYQVQFRTLGTLPFSSGPSTVTPAATVTGLSANTTYEFEIITRNSAGSSTSLLASSTTLKVPPAPATNLLATQVQTTAVTLTWTAPSTGSQPFTYVVQYRVTGTVPFSTFQVGAGTIGVTVIGLQPSTTYDFEVLTSNQ